jgi:uncharacterized membrane protein (DUF106 family)
MAWLGGLFDFIFYPLVNYLPPRWSLIAISFILTLLITLAHKFLTNQHLVKSLKEEVKNFQKEMKNHKENPEKLTEINQKAMAKNLELMKHSMRPTLYTFIPIILIFSWMRETYLPAGDLFSWSVSFWPFGPGIGWLWTYILSSIVFSIVLRKVLKIH